MISILCPTRERPDILRRMIDSALATADGALEILLYFDDDDKTRNGDFSPTIKMVGPSDGIGKAWNRLAEKSTGDYLMMANDDIIFRTKHWDSIFYKRIRQYPDGIFVAYFYDGNRLWGPNNDEIACVFPLVSRKWYEALGYFVPEIFSFWAHDTWLQEMGKELGRCLPIPEATVEHMIYAYKKAEFDNTYKRHVKELHPPFKGGHNDVATLNKNRDTLKNDAGKLRALMRELSA